MHRNGIKDSWFYYICVKLSHKVMLIRFFANNVFSFGEEKEFHMIPAPNGRRLKDHKYQINKFEILKMSSVYGANAAGKSNLVRALRMLQDVVTEEALYIRQVDTQFKFRDKQELPQMLGAEFYSGSRTYYYALKVVGNRIDEEELYESGLGRKEDTLIFERKTNADHKTSIRFFAEFSSTEENKVLGNVIEKNLSKYNKPILKLLITLENDLLNEKIKDAFDWFDNTLNILTPYSKPNALVEKIDANEDFRKYAQDTLCAFHIGVEKLIPEKKLLEHFFGEDDEKELDVLKKKVEESPNKKIALTTKRGLQLVIVKEDDIFYVKQLKLEHIGKNNKVASFDLDEESDGTVRLLDFIPAFKDIFSKEKVYVIDEIERSIHPVLIKELVRKFSIDNQTKGQLIFTTHESNLLDQDIFRQDEIWFAEKNKDGVTDLYSLSDFKEHSTIDIRKGYLTGRYGSIPFLSNLQDLNWHTYDKGE